VGVYAPADRGPDSYAVGHPDGGDLYLTDTIRAEPGDWAPAARPRRASQTPGYCVLIRWDEVAYMEVYWT
jgi:hypothetical protein